MLPCSGNNLTVPHNSDSLGDDVLTTVGGHLDVHSSPILLKGGGHFCISHPVSEVANLDFTGVYSPIELVDVVAGFGEFLVGGCHSLAYCGDKTIDDSVCGVVKVVAVLHAKDGFC